MHRCLQGTPGNVITSVIVSTTFKHHLCPKCAFVFTGSYGIDLYDQIMITTQNIE